MFRPHLKVQLSSEMVRRTRNHAAQTNLGERAFETRQGAIDLHTFHANEGSPTGEVQTTPQATQYKARFE